MLRAAMSCALAGAAGAGLAGCGTVPNPLTLDVVISSPVWLADGWIYFLRQESSDAPFNIWRRHPDGSDQGLFASPAPAACPHTPMLFLFSGPHGRLGAGVSCAGERRGTSLVEYSNDGRTTTELATVDNAVAATWRAGTSRAYVEQINSSCVGVAPLEDGKLGSFPAPMSMDGLTWPLDPGATNYSCSGTGHAYSPAVTKDGRSVYFLAASDPYKELDSHGADALKWRVFRWDVGAAQPVEIGPVLMGGAGLRLTPDDQSLVVVARIDGVSGILLINVKDGTVKTISTDLDVSEIDLSPDGRMLVVLTKSDRVEIVRATP